ncbi:hypothetical protein [Subtercola lobariae]|uniref:Uncharacterized protein n=1 Tax=Subtercola lobariae TaxID=1588641 RepID=A0A917B3F0_9MICO|nr:hypothetical protein [Subtercola lobariae]GGF16032.1 hypothetical protein GCM10011399_07320 [Subtercola lobariae]
MAVSLSILNAHIASTAHAQVAPLVRTAATGQFLGVDWGAFALVAVVSFIAAVVIVVFYSLALRLFAVGSADDTDAPASAGGAATANADGAGATGMVSSERGHRPFAATAGAYVCLAIGIAAVLYSVYLIVPQFH